ncbi:RelA/SpoT family protein [Patescibacteria group bacterium]|nr:RelA/SpoT family protein [Patescibacteria group bacterium]MBU1421007.1 RelA/SpoT family protein [Patescibacteria group bacterium]MBU2456407.1 RelA/SpoT family protein [Patescibacteria group bacterium]MBU2474569.1 RelA/SpoT family protein [Patescibacteria group bacterium]
MTIEQIINEVKKNDSSADIDLLKLAYDFAKIAHQGQKRLDEEPYIQHSLHTAFMLAQIKADLSTVTAGLLHDTIEDSEHTFENIEKNFGAEIANLVQGITKLGTVKYRGVERYKENLRKMFLAMVDDLRVVLIKFCDRLHNLRTLNALSKEKQLRIAKETLEIYAPIAGLLGVWRLKWQMEDICFKYLHPEEFQKLKHKYEVVKKIEHKKFIEKTKHILEKELQKANIQHQIEGRFKHLYNIYQKMQRKDKKFHEIYDVFALRIIVPTIADCYKVLGIVHAIWWSKMDRFKDYISMPKPNGYQSLHTTVFGYDDKLTEFQIRTQEMHDAALYGIAAHWHYKEKGDLKKPQKQPFWIKEILNAQREAKNTHDFITEVKLNIFHNRIFVFSPKGDVFDLPEEATAIDFAYAVHTEIGDKATGALINEKMSVLSQQLKNGDMVEIIIEKNRKHPNRAWLKFAKTHRAKSKIKQHIKVKSL